MHRIGGALGRGVLGITGVPAHLGLSPLLNLGSRV